MENIYYVFINGMHFASMDIKKLRDLLNDTKHNDCIYPRYFAEILLLSRTRNIYIL